MDGEDRNIYITWLLLMALQLLSLAPYMLWLVVLSPIFITVFLLGVYLHQLHLFAHSAVWNSWFYLLTGEASLI